MCRLDALVQSADAVCKTLYSQGVSRAITEMQKKRENTGVERMELPMVAGSLSRLKNGDYELEVEDVPPPISEEALTIVFERIMQGVPASEVADGAEASPTLESR